MPSGTARPELPAGHFVEEGPFDPALVSRLPAMEYEPSWQNATESMINLGAEVHATQVRRGARVVAYGLVMPGRGRVTQIGVEESSWDGPVPSVVLDRLCRATRSTEIAAINVDPGARRTLELLSSFGFTEQADQYEMTKPLEQ